MSEQQSKSVSRPCEWRKLTGKWINKKHYYLVVGTFGSFQGARNLSWEDLGRSARVRDDNWEKDNREQFDKFVRDHNQSVLITMREACSALNLSGRFGYRLSVTQGFIKSRPGYWSIGYGQDSADGFGDLNTHWKPIVEVTLDRSKGTELALQFTRDEGIQFARIDVYNFNIQTFRDILDPEIRRRLS